MKKIGFLSFGHWSASPYSQVRTAADALLQSIELAVAAEEVGADLSAMQDAWWMPGVQLPGEELEGRPLSRVFLGERALPHSIMVNSKGERFANEALAYDQFGELCDRAGGAPLAEFVEARAGAGFHRQSFEVAVADALANGRFRLVAVVREAAPTVVQSMRFLNASGGSYSDATTTCRLIIED